MAAAILGVSLTTTSPQHPSEGQLMLLLADALMDPAPVSDQALMAEAIKLHELGRVLTPARAKRVVLRAEIKAARPAGQARQLHSQGLTL